MNPVAQFFQSQSNGAAATAAQAALSEAIQVVTPSLGGLNTTTQSPVYAGPTWARARRSRLLS